ncbi:phospholipase D-like domain-containing protein [Xanthobacter sediminis]|uniref:phospholipase D-like domain-containing protein n=1 Tax=Xanthobacter sediminis TaxID=3119926 RepID=UPI00372C478E
MAISRTAASALAALFLAAMLPLSPARAEPAVPTVELHHSPAEDLERIDVALIASAQARIDMAAYFLTDPAVIDALLDAVKRGVAVRVVLDPTHEQAYALLAPLGERVRKKPRRPIMHLKAFAVDGKVLRTGSANFSANALKQQDNDLLILRDPALAKAYLDDYERIWNSAVPLQ